jgi:Asp/Glu/hydantoin racemase
VAGGPRIVLIHAVPVAMAPIEAAFAEHWPEAERVSLLDDSLSTDRARDTALTPAMQARIAALGDYAAGIGAAGILYTCSAFGPAIEAVARRLPVPVLKPNEAMFDAALDRGPRLGMLATFGPSVASMEAELRDAAAARGLDATLTTVLVEGALDALKAGDAATHDCLVAARAAELAGCDAVMLAHFSTARALTAVRAVIAAPVLASPASAVMKLRRQLATPAECAGADKARAARVR